tara:strand:- start:13257 stop:13532 length:276 start_codon:yes stop_codon:yes gene_type:complete
MNMQATFVNAAESHFRSLMDAAALKINLLSSNPVGVGDHADVLNDFISAVTEFKDAQDGFNTMQQFKRQMMSPEAQETSEDVILPEGASEE